MFNKFKVIKETIKLIQLANRMSDDLPGDRPKFGYLLTNRSFLVPAIGILVNILILLDSQLFSPVLSFLQEYSPELAAETIVTWITMLSLMWALIERMFTNAKAVLTPKQAEKALAEVVGDDKLARAMRKALK